ncbi:MAG: hypothetical protein RL139_1276 [Gemmatimonadota bacterium]|jgi:hypothetical protein
MTDQQTLPEWVRALGDVLRETFGAPPPDMDASDEWAQDIMGALEQRGWSLASIPSQEPRGLDEAWREAEAVLERLAHGGQWELRVGHFTPSNEYWADGSYLEMYTESIVTIGPTPAAALLALAARLGASE